MNPHIAIITINIIGIVHAICISQSYPNINTVATIETNTKLNNVIVIAATKIDIASFPKKDPIFISMVLLYDLVLFF